MRHQLLLSTVLIGTALSPAIAQEAPKTEEELPEITIFGEQDSYFEAENSTALKGASEEMKTPFSTNTLNSDVIEDLKANRLEKAFTYIPGFTRSGTNANSFTIRGHSADLQNLQVDGLPGLTNRFGSPTTANIERVEVLKGPASVLYGWMDPGGLVNMITKKPEAEARQEINFFGQSYTEYGELGYGASFDVTGKLTEDGSLLYRFIGGYENEDSYRDYVDDNKSMYVFPSLSWLPDEDRRLDIQMEYTKDERKADTGLFVLNQDINQRADITTYYQEPGDTDEDEGYSLSAHYAHQLDKDLKLNLKWRSLWHTDERDLYEANSVQSDDTLRRRNRHQYNERQYHFADANLDMDFEAGLPQKLLVGASGGYEYRQYDRLAFDSRGANVSLINPSYTGDVLTDDPGNFRKWDLWNLGAYAQDQIFVTDALTLVLGGRYDTQQGDYELKFIDNDTTQKEDASIQTTAYNAGVVYQVSPMASIYTSYSESFNPQAIPTFDENNTQLDPERGVQYEAGIKLAFLNNKLNANLAVFDLTKENVSETVDGTPRLVGTIESQGTEVTLQYQPMENWQFQTGYTYTNAKVAETTDDDALNNVPGFAPEHTASLLARYNHPKEVMGGLVGMGLGWRYQSERYTDEETEKRVLLPSYHVADMNFYYELETMKLSLNIDNLLDETYFTGGTNDTRIYTGDPRKVTLNAKFTF